ncbi:MAG: YncE family protein [Acidobacteriales bacterium]|nr:YncE family protein [Terriglobales bacterium]
MRISFISRAIALGLLALFFSMPAAAESPKSASGPLLLVLNKSENTLVTVDPGTLKVLGRYPTGNGPHEAAVSADGRLAYVSNYGTGGQPGNSLSVIDLPSGKSNQVDLGKLLRPHGIMESEGKIYFTAEGSRTVARFDPKSQSVDWSRETGQNVTHMVVVLPSAKKLYTANIGSNSVTVVELDKPEGVKQIAVGEGAEGIDITPDGREVWVGNRGDGSISIIDTSSDKVKETINVGKVPIRVKVTPDGKRVLATDAESGELIVIDAASRKVTKRLPMGGTPVGLLITPDGKKAFVASTASNKVTEVDLTELAIGRSLEPGREPDGLAWASR